MYTLVIVSKYTHHTRTQTLAHAPVLLARITAPFDS